MDNSDLSTVGSETEGVTDGVEPVVYDCTAWAGESRRLFASLLEMEGLASAWQGTEVTVFSADTETVEQLVDQVLSTARAAIDTDAPTIIYEVGEWPDALQNEFAAQLTISEVAYIWNVDGDIVVNESDEHLVEEVLDMLPDAESFDNVDGLQVQELLNEMFMVCDRVASKPADDRALGELRRLAGVVGSISVPFGFDDNEWKGLVDAVDQASTDEAQLSDKSRSKVAKAARDRLKRYI